MDGGPAQLDAARQVTQPHRAQTISVAQRTLGHMLEQDPHATRRAMRRQHRLHHGSVDLSGEHPDWPRGLLDPLMFETSADYYIDSYEDQVEQGEVHPGGPFDLDFAPDDLHKGDISGGPPYAVRAPNPGVDGVVIWEIHQTTFVNYLRTVIRFAGMGGFSPTRRHGRKALPVPPDVLNLASELEEF